MCALKKLGIIGAGNMATAISRGIISQGSIEANNIMAYDHNPDKLNTFTGLGMLAAKDENDLVANCRYILLAVKPQGYPALLEKIAPSCHSENVFISIAAGITADYIKGFVGANAKVVLVMPNTPMLVSSGAAVLALVPPVTQQEFDEVKALFSASAVACQIQPTLMNEAIPLHGSSPAMFYLIAKTLVEDAVARGIEFDTANELVCSTMIGSAKMMLQSGKPHQELIDMVCSRGGTTLAMLGAMEEKGLTYAIKSGLDACIKRAYELGK